MNPEFSTGFREAFKLPGGGENLPDLTDCGGFSALCDDVVEDSVELSGGTIGPADFHQAASVRLMRASNLASISSWVR